MRYLLFAVFLLSAQTSLVAQQNVGIGTSSPDPSALLHVSSINKGVLFPTLTESQKNTIPTPPRGLLIYQTDNNAGFYVNKSVVPVSPSWSLVSEGINYWSPMTGNPANIFNTNAGNIGLGISSPTEKLHIENGRILLSRNAASNNNILFNMPAGAALAGENEGLNLQVDGVDKGFIGYSSHAIIGNAIRLSNSTPTASDLIISSNGFTGLGTASPSEKLTVVGNALVRSNGSIFLEKTGGTRTVEIKSTESGSDGASVLLYNNAGLATIEMDADFGDGDGRIITSELQIRGGSDLAEKFNLVSEDEKKIQPGMLVSIDPNLEGALCITKQANDKKVVGVVSGANGIKTGMLMGQQESIANGKYPVALAGRVYVLTDNEGGEIRAGDFLTSASRHGYAKKANKPGKSQGALIGKAMGKADPVTGYVLVLINLQ